MGNVIVLFSRITLPEYLSLLNKSVYLQNGLPETVLKNAKNDFYMCLTLFYNLHPFVRSYFLRKDISILTEEKKTGPFSGSFSENAKHELSKFSSSTNITPISAIEDYEQNIYKYIAVDEKREITREDRVEKIYNQLESVLLLFVNILEVQPPPELFNRLKAATFCYLQAIEGFHYSRAAKFLKYAESSSSRYVKQVQKELAKEKLWQNIEKFS